MSTSQNPLTLEHFFAQSDFSLGYDASQMQSLCQASDHWCSAELASLLAELQGSDEETKSDVRRTLLKATQPSVGGIQKGLGQHCKRLFDSFFPPPDPPANENTITKLSRKSAKKIKESLPKVSPKNTQPTEERQRVVSDHATDGRGRCGLSLWLLTRSHNETINNRDPRSHRKTPYTLCTHEEIDWVRRQPVYDYAGKRYSLHQLLAEFHSDIDYSAVAQKLAQGRVGRYASFVAADK